MALPQAGELLKHLAEASSATHTLGLPSPEALQAIQGYNVPRTEQNGWIELTTDGEQMWVEVERR